MGERTSTTVAALAAGLDVHDDVVEGRHGDVRVRRYRGDGDGATLVWMHGGAFSGGDLDGLESHAVAATLARQGVSVVTVDYRKVPSWSPFRDAPAGQLPGIRFPIPLDDVIDVFVSVAEHRRAVSLGGASAGACLSAAAALSQVRNGAPVPHRLLLAYGTFHAALPPIDPLLRSRIRGHHGLLQFRPTTVRRMNHNYAGNAEAMNDPFAFPGGHRLTGMPPTLLLDADRDSLRASGQAFAQELAAAGVDVEHHVIPDTSHAFLNRPGTPAFDRAIQLLSSQLSA